MSDVHGTLNYFKCNSFFDILLQKNETKQVQEGFEKNGFAKVSSVLQKC